MAGLHDRDRVTVERPEPSLPSYAQVRRRKGAV
jgi:hypothetical protein